MPAVITPGNNAIHWFEWKPESFELAKFLDRPILLNLTAVWCDTCKEMEDTSYGDPEVIPLANELFIPLRVNVDQRPDIHERYNFGGLPTTAILTPEAETISAGTYIPPAELKAWLLSQSEYFRVQKHEIMSRLAAFSGEEDSPRSEGKLTQLIVSDVQQSLLENFDRVYGGFGTQPKFPLPEAIELALVSALTQGQEAYLRIITKTLDEMAIGGLFDRIEGGFHRFSVTRDWSSPHYAKMLEGNAELLRNYVRGYRLTGLERYRQIAERTIEYLLNTLHESGTSAFYGSQAADGAYYDLSKKDREGKIPPPIDRTFYTCWNACTISSLLEAASLAPKEWNLVSLCERLGSFLFKKGLDEERGMHHYFDPEPKLTGLFDDNLEMACALLELYMATSDAVHLREAERLAEVMVDRFWDAANGGGFLDRVEEDSSFGALRRPQKKIDENSQAAEFFLKLSCVTGRLDYKQLAEHALNPFAESYGELGVLASSYARSVNLALQGAIKIEVVGSREEADFRELLQAAFDLLEPRRVVVPLGNEENRQKSGESSFSGSEAYARISAGVVSSSIIRRPEELAERVDAVARIRS